MELLLLLDLEMLIFEIQYDYSTEKISYEDKMNFTGIINRVIEQVYLDIEKGVKYES
jgi:hypothetical protein